MTNTVGIRLAPIVTFYNYCTSFYSKRVHIAIVLKFIVYRDTTLVSAIEERAIRYLWVDLLLQNYYRDNIIIRRTSEHRQSTFHSRPQVCRRRRERDNYVLFQTFPHQPLIKNTINFRSVQNYLTRKCNLLVSGKQWLLDATCKRRRPTPCTKWLMRSFYSHRLSIHQ